MLKRPAKKWVDRRFSEERIKRIGPLLQEYHNTHNQIFFTAEQILQDESLRNGKLIFVGQAMRPLFESVRALNELERKIPRKNIVYVVTPSYVRDNPDGKDFVKSIKEQPRGKKSFRQSGKTYYVIDYRSSNFTTAVFEAALKSIDPLGKINLIDQTSSDYGTGIIKAEFMGKPTLKRNGKLEKAVFISGYLAFQKALQEYIDKRKGKMQSR